MGWSTTIIPPPDGDVGAYLDSLRVLSTAPGSAALPHPRCPGRGAPRVRGSTPRPSPRSRGRHPGPARHGPEVARDIVDVLYADVRKDCTNPQPARCSHTSASSTTRMSSRWRSKGLDRVVEDGLGSPLTASAPAQRRDRDLDRVVAGEVVVAVADLLHHRFVGETDVVACWHRVLNRHPAGGWIGEGSSPSMSPSLTSTVGAGSGIDASSARVYGCRGCS